MTFQLVIWPLKGATSVTPGSAVCLTVAETAIVRLGSALVSGLPSVTVAARAAEGPRSERAPATPTAATFCLIDKRGTKRLAPYQPYLHRLSAHRSAHRDIGVLGPQLHLAGRVQLPLLPPLRLDQQPDPAGCGCPITGDGGIPDLDAPTRRGQLARVGNVGGDLGGALVLVAADRPEGEGRGGLDVGVERDLIGVRPERWPPRATVGETWLPLVADGAGARHEELPLLEDPEVAAVEAYVVTDP